MKSLKNMPESLEIITLLAELLWSFLDEWGKREGRKIQGDSVRRVWNDDWFCRNPSAVLKIFDHWGDVLICLLINT